jgi:hypothetical protein
MEEERADIVVRYYSDETSYILRPKQMEGPFLSIFKKDKVVALAKRRTGRELAVVVMINYIDESKKVAVKRDWRERLGDLGYHRVVFLRAVPGMKINGLAIMEDEVALTHANQPEGVAVASTTRPAL